MDKVLKIFVTVSLFFLGFMITVICYYFININNNLEKRIDKYFPPVEYVVQGWNGNYE